MTDKKFSDEEIIKALEWCIQNSECEYCEYREKTDKSDICPIRMDALNLINKQNAEIEQLKRNLEQCENGYSQELHLARCQLADAKSEVEKLVQDGTRLVQENETLKDNNEHLAVILEETKIELDAMRGAANSLKMHYEKAEAEVEKLQNELVIWKQNRFNLFQRLECYETARQKVASEIFAEIETLLALNILVGDVFTGKYFDADLENDLAELKKKYTEGEG